MVYQYRNTGSHSRRSSDIVTNLPSELMIVIPKLAKGTYLIEVVTQYGGTTPLEEPRTAIFDKPLTVN